MKTISYAITIKDELSEIQSLLPFLLKNKRNEDEIIILYDSKNGSKQVLEYLKANIQESQPQFYLSQQPFNGNFADWKNELNNLCTKDYIINLDADEMLYPEFMSHIPWILENNPEVDLFWVPRENRLEGEENDVKKWVDKWGWRVDMLGRINYPDFQARIYKNQPNIYWAGNVHETIRGEGVKRFTQLPMESKFDIIHTKSIERQIQQNQYYSTL